MASPSASAAIVTVWLSFTSVACGDAQTGSIYVKTMDVVAATGAVFAVEASDSPELAGTRLDIPAGALAADTRVTLTLERTPMVESPALAAGPVAVFGPAGTIFAAEVALALPYDATAAAEPQLYLEQRLDDDSLIVLRHPGIVFDETLGHATITSLGRFAVAAVDCAAHPDPALCGSHEVCGNHLDDDLDGGADCDDAECVADPGCH